MMCLRGSRTVSFSLSPTRRIVDRISRTALSQTVPRSPFQPARSLSFATSSTFRSLFPPTRTTTQSPLSTTFSSLLLSTPGSASRQFSTTAALGAKRNTYNPSRRVQKRRHGFLARLRCRGGRNVLSRRRFKGRKYLTW
ncbi:hypothetical protein CPSG_04118 [Coccidioides posadasii str. Silveira]|uniref:Large ribosomal subunit protein bL34m n=2 Tax=Coccidioides posadasii TaxID=199306 RepID=E9D1R0_COCPS|nr:hypothetical protein CPSG_04118 [Coccidioides posadasii str. Silveira]KMM72186.1 hypothetical protein CPAG_08484 [Coccidioides posadasii RMSCC 3488]